MSENNKRMMLDDEMLEDVTGGNVLYVCNQTDHYCYGAHNPDVKYEFRSRREMLAFVDQNYDYYGEAGIFNAMVAAGIVTKMDNSSSGNLHFTDSAAAKQGTVCFCGGFSVFVCGLCAAF